MKKVIRYFLLAFFINFSFVYVFANSDINAEIFDGTITGDGSIIINVSGSSDKKPNVDLVVTKTINSEGNYLSAWQGDLLSIEVVVKNLGIDKAYNVEIKDFIDNEVAYDVYGYSDICSDMGNYLYCMKDSLAPGESIKISYLIKVKHNARVGIMETYARASSSAKDLFPENNLDSVRVMIQNASYVVANPLYATHLSIKHDARERNQNGNWKSANTLSSAAEILLDADMQEIQYRIILKNDGNTAGYDIKVKSYFSSNNMARLEIKNVENAKWDSSSSIFIVPKVDANSSVEIVYIATIKAIDFGVLSARSTAVIYDTRPANLNTLNSSLVKITGIGETDDAYIQSVGSINTASSKVSSNTRSSNTTNINYTTANDKIDADYYLMPISGNVTRRLSSDAISNTVTRNTDYVATYYNSARSSNLMRTGSSGFFVLIISIFATTIIYSFKKYKIV